jgi:hypothetical protein
VWASDGTIEVEKIPADLRVEELAEVMEKH